MSDKLKPCPFCGGEHVRCRWNYMGDGFKYREIHCNNCSATLTKYSEYVEDDIELCILWNTRAETNAITSETNGITRETSVIEQPVESGEADSREQLEADVRGAVHGAYAYEDYIPEDMIFGWLNRQALITADEANRIHGEGCEACRAAQKRRLAELTAERGRLSRDLEAEHALAMQLQDDTDRLRAELAECDEQRIEYRDQRDHLEAEVKDQRKRKAAAEQKLNALVNRLREQHVGIMWNDGISDWHVSLPIAELAEVKAECDELDEMRERYARALNQIADALGVEIIDDAGTHAREMAAIEKLRAERDELQSIIDHMPKTEAECEACQEAHDRLMFNSGVDIGKLRDKVDRLTAERDDLQNLIDQERLAHLARVDELEFQRDGISEKADRLMDKCGKLQEAMNRAAGNWAKKDAELRVMTIAFNSVNDKLTEKQHVCDVQRDSFLKMERDLSDANERIGELERTIENMRGD